MKNKAKKLASILLSATIVIAGVNFTTDEVKADTGYLTTDNFQISYDAGTNYPNTTYGDTITMFEGDIVTYEEIIGTDGNGSWRTEYAPSTTHTTLTTKVNGNDVTSGFYSYTVNSADENATGQIVIETDYTWTDSSDPSITATGTATLTINVCDDLFLVTSDGTTATRVSDYNMSAKQGDSSSVFYIREKHGYSYSWACSNPNVASVYADDLYCIISPNNAGNCTITCTSTSGKTVTINWTTESATTTTTTTKRTVTPTPVDAVQNPIFENATQMEQTAAASAYQSVTSSSTGEMVRVCKAVSGSGVKVQGNVSFMPPTGILYDTKLDSTNATYQAAVDKVSSSLKSASVAAVYNFDLKNSGGAYFHELQDYATVSVPRPAGIVVGKGQTITVYRLEDDGTLTKLETAFSDNEITFKTNHFSTYVFVVEGANAGNGSTSSNSSSPKTGEE